MSSTYPQVKTNKAKLFLGWAMILGTVALVAVAALVRWPGIYVATISQADVQKALTPPTLNGTYPCVNGAVSGGEVDSELGSCTTPVSHENADDQFETDLRYGSFVVRQTDLPLDDVFNAPLERAYSSSDWGSPSHRHAFGFNASDSFDIAPTGTRWPYTYMTLMLEDNDFLYFKRISSGVGYANAVFLHTESSTRFYGATIAWNGNGWTLRLTDGSEMLFPEAYSSKNLAQGAAYEIRNAAGDKLILKRDGERNLEEVLTPNGHWIRVQDDDQGRIVRASNDEGETVSYQYSAEGMLTDVLNSNGTERHYQYDGRLMTEVTDGQGNALVRNWYQDGEVVRQLFNGRDLYTYQYTPAPGGHSMSRVTVTLPDLSRQEVYPSSSVPAFLGGQR